VPSNFKDKIHIETLTLQNISGIIYKTAIRLLSIFIIISHIHYMKIMISLRDIFSFHVLLIPRYSICLFVFLPMQPLLYAFTCETEKG
jgi:hypothetical protein